MQVAIYGRPIQHKNFSNFFSEFTDCLSKYSINYLVLNEYAAFLKKEYNIDAPVCHSGEMLKACDVLISLGGDGTILDTLGIVKDSGLPVMGINLGRLGFLANIKMGEYEEAIKALADDEIVIDERAVLELLSDGSEFGDFPFALNDVVVQKRDTSAMITVKAWLNNDFLNAYWADGLILSTPTGSSGYSMSCGGPLLFPGSNAFVLTPIAAHNLTVRPVVISDKHLLKFEVSSRNDTVLVSLDSQSFQVPGNTSFKVRRAGFNFRMVRLSNTSHMDTIRNKLMWGIDSRNRIDLPTTG